MIIGRRRSVLVSLAVSGVLCYAFAQAQPATTPMQHEGRHDFDFEVGHWNAHVKTLTHRLSHSTDWDELSGTVVTRTLPLLEGWNESEMRVDSAKSGRHIELLAVRMYNPSIHQWAIYGSNIKSGAFDPPLFGQFSNGRGEFYAQDTWEGRPVFVRYIWKSVDANHTNFEQAFSDDGGKTWETNWIYEGERVSK